MKLEALIERVSFNEHVITQNKKQDKAKEKNHKASNLYSSSVSIMHINLPYL